jgi:superoxide reductase
MDRRTLLSLGAAGAASGIVMPRIVFAAADAGDPFKSPFAGSLFYTADKPGRWAGKQGGHVPTFDRSGSKIEVTTGHEMDEFNHYIIKHVILDENFGFVRETMFDPRKGPPVSQHDIAGLENVVYAISLCNKHDAWLNALVL